MTIDYSDEAGFVARSAFVLQGCARFADTQLDFDLIKLTS